MPIYKIIRQETESRYLFIEAESPDQAEEIADEKDTDGWKKCHDYDCKTVSRDIAPEDEIKGSYIDTADGYYRHD